MFQWNKPAKGYSGNRYSKQGMEYHVAKERERESAVAEMNRYVTQSTVSNQEAVQVKRAQGARRRNASLKRAGEQQLEQQYEATRYREKLGRDRKKDLALARQLAEMKRQEEKREREVQAICAADPSLRALNEKIKTAYMNRDRKMQIEQREQRQRQIEQEQAQLEKDMEQQRRKSLLVVQERDEKRRAAAMKQKVEIQAQLRERQASEQLQAILKYQQEKQQVEELIQQVYHEQRKEAEEQQHQAQLMRHNMEEGLTIQRQRREEQAMQEAEEDRRIAAYKERVAHRNDAADAEKKANDEIKERIRQQIEDEMTAQLAKEERMRDALQLLGEEEANQRREAAERAKKEKTTRMRHEMMVANEEQQQYKQVRTQEERDFEDDILRRMQEKFDSDNRVAREKEAARRSTLHDYKQQIAHQMKERSDMWTQALEQDAQQQKYTKEQEAYKAKVIEEARKRILEAHAAQLQGYLPKGVLQKESDLEFLRQSSASPQRGQTR